MPQPPNDSDIRNTEAYYHVVLERIPPQAEPAFESDSMQRRVWGREWGVHDDIGLLRLCVVHRPGNEISIIDEAIYDAELDALISDREQWYWRDRTAPDLDLMQSEHDGLVAALQSEGVEVEFVDASPGDPKAVFTRDQAIAVNGGAIICRMGPVGEEHGYGRRGEERYISRLLASLGMPILRTIHGTGLFEGGSFCFLNRDVALAGMSHRQNEAGVRQIEQVLAEQGVRLLRVPLTGHALHIDGAIVMVDHDKALVNVTRLPYWLPEELESLGIKTIHAWPTEPWSVNCLAVRPGRVIIAGDCPRTVDRLHKMGVETIEIPYAEIRKNGGGIHCSTLPLIRDAT